MHCAPKKREIRLNLTEIHLGTAGGGVHLIASATGIPYSLSEAGWAENSPGARSLTGGANKRLVMQKD